MNAEELAALAEEKDHEEWNDGNNPDCAVKTDQIEGEQVGGDRVAGETMVDVEGGDAEEREEAIESLAKRRADPSYP